MVTFKDLITGDISDSPSDRLAAPILLFLTFPVVVPCSVVYYTAKGVKYLGETVKDKIDDVRYYKELERRQAEEQAVTITEEPVIEQAQTKKPKVLSLRNNNKKM